jgi:putative membrane protein
MINYNPKDWLLAIFRFHKSDTFRALFPMIIFVVIYSWLVVYLEIHYFKLSENSHARNLTIMHTLLGFAISMLLVFRTNTAYDRWWEGRKLWGALVNNSRNLAIKLNALLPKNDSANRHFFRQAIPLFALLLKRHLQRETTRLELDEQPHPEIPEMDTNKHMPNRLADSIVGKVNRLYTEKVISGDQLIICNNELQSFMDISGACERIKNTPIPFSYSTFIKKFIFIYVMTLPFGFAFNLGYYTIPVTTFIFYVLASLELIAEEIEDPFGEDSNDLPMQKISDNIRKNVAEILV